jgi:hypothetical protein
MRLQVFDQTGGSEAIGREGKAASSRNTTYQSPENLQEELIGQELKRRNYVTD